MAIVTKQSMIKVLTSNNEALKEHYIGRALVGLFNRQVTDEQSSNTTRIVNSRGFASSDAYDGSLTAKHYIKHGKLLDWQVKRWTRDFRGAPRLSKYHAQLNEIAEQKAKEKAR